MNHDDGMNALRQQVTDDFNYLDRLEFSTLLREAETSQSNALAELDSVGRVPGRTQRHLRQALAEQRHAGEQLRLAATFTAERSVGDDPEAAWWRDRAGEVEKALNQQREATVMFRVGTELPWNPNRDTYDLDSTRSTLDEARQRVLAAGATSPGFAAGGRRVSTPSPQPAGDDAPSAGQSVGEHSPHRRQGAARHSETPTDRGRQAGPRR
ncbi:hypothetical protein ABT336_16900 [Micromonospora sp. NPDC000207]|uniref:hypothetical protein n=1 Tax=Micromonospora sp. NPDC000207 TaxID=3154246 RepID=UPI0033261B71